MSGNTNWLKTTEGPVLLTEGDNDCHVIAALCRAHSLPEGCFGFYSCGSDDKAITRLKLLLKSGINCPERFAIVLDADAPSLASKWQSLRSILNSNGYEIPEKPSSKGTILTAAGKPLVGIWMMPDNNLDGMLEDFCLRLAPQEALNLAEEYITKCKESGHATFKDAHHSKALVHSFLGTQDEPGSPLGQAITRKVLSSEEEIAKDFTNWLVSAFAS
ncbi:DUF3226 domain-containing protein [Vibrio parahaemolyticus]|uniref:DUF4435 domain-containing protein n=1 Tax=marine metagenome TaxID=408172 RepID=A0A5E4DMP7_9ZZZZ|nr:DUF3226 domain-containing protein [Vibrio parahaemolyticus]MBM5089582.1 hypothetical protein [Vibrio parahaemolyticus]MBM5182684.1 hypothetical protein [Vibrio parahaemolyticus]HCE2071765.1 hypothetical protein [Vibrio parahaemolyticus]HCH5310381.1 hypothetical protein [Vibrio parahaemolyticus]